MDAEVTLAVSFTSSRPFPKADPSKYAFAESTFSIWMVKKVWSVKKDCIALYSYVYFNVLAAYRKFVIIKKLSIVW